MSISSDFWKALNQSGVQISGSSNKSSGGSTATGIAPVATPSSTKKKKKKSVSDELWDSLQGAEIDLAPVGSKSGSTVASRVQARASGRKKDEDDDKPLDFFQKGAFEDGFDWSDIPKVILGTAGDAGLGLLKGAGGIAEGLVDLVDYGIAGVADLAGADGYADDLRKATQENLVEKFTQGATDYLDQYSVLGRTSDAILQGLGQVGGIVATGGLGASAGLSGAGVSALTTGVMGLSGVGSGIGEAYQGGATDEEAVKYGLISGAADALSELMFGGMGKAVNALGFSRGLSSADDILAKAVSGKFKNQIAKNFAEYGVKASAEGLEEVVAGVAQAMGKKLTYMSEEEMKDILGDENLLEQFIVGMVTSGMIQSGIVPGTKDGSLVEANKAGKDFITGQTQNEKAVIDKLVADRIAEREQKGDTLSKRDRSDIEEAVIRELEKGYISIDTIEEVLGGDSYKNYKKTLGAEDAQIADLEKQIKELEGAPNTVGNSKKYDALQAKLETVNKRNKSNDMKSRLEKEVFELAKGDRLVESYNERGRRGQAFEADVTKYDAKQQAVIQKAIDSGILNNTNRTHEFVDFIAKISADKGVSFDFTNNAKLKDSGFAVDGKQVNGYVTKDGITLNIDSAKAMESTVGHEITHVLEGTEFYDSLKQTIFDYAKTKGEYQSRYDSLAEIYKGVKDADIEGELTADLVGDYLFSDPDFIKNLSTQNRNIFQKIYDEIKYLCKVVTAGSKEARELERVKKAFEDAYREGGKTPTVTEPTNARGITNTTLLDAIDQITNIGRVTNSMAETILRDSEAVAQIVQLTKAEITGTRAAQRNIVKEAMYQIAGIKDATAEIAPTAQNAEPQAVQEMQNDEAIRETQFQDQERRNNVQRRNSVYTELQSAKSEQRKLQRQIEKTESKLQESGKGSTARLNQLKTQFERQTNLVNQLQSQYDYFAEDYDRTLEGAIQTQQDLFEQAKQDALNAIDAYNAGEITRAQLDEAKQKYDNAGREVYRLKHMTQEEYSKELASVGMVADRQNMPNSKTTPTVATKYSLSDSNGTPINEVTPNGLTMTYVRVPNQNTPYYGSTYGQNIEPAGEYMSMDTMQGKYKIDGYEYGTIQFKKPLVLEHINTGATGWKKTVSDMYGGLTGKKLTKALIKDGYDAIVTYDDYGYNEIVNLNGQKFSLSNAGEQHTPNSLSALRLETDDIAPVAESSVVAEKATEAPIYESKDKSAPEGQTTMFEPVEEKKTTRKEYHQSIIDKVKARFAEKGFDLDKVLKNAKNLSTWSTVDNTPQRVMEKALGYKEGGILADITVNQVAQNETEGIKWINKNVELLKQISKDYNIKPGSKESAAAQMYAEGFFVNENNEIIRYGDPELAQDFKDPKVRQNIKRLARDPRIRKIYDDALASINESRTRNLYPEIPKLDNYFLHFRAMNDTFSTLGLPFNPNDIRANDLPTDLNGVTADLKPGQPYFASANHRRGKRTSFDMLGGIERYLTSAKNQIYHIDDIQTLRALRNYIAETYGQATGLEDLDSMTDAEAEERIQQVYGSHLSTFAKFLNEEANVLAGKTALIDRGIEGFIGRRGITFLNTLNKQVGSNMVGYNVSSSLTNFLPVAQTFAKTNKFDFVKAFAQTVANKVSRGKFDTFSQDSPVVIRRKGEDRFYRTFWQNLADPGYALMGMVDDISTEIIARTKYNEFTRKGMDSQKAHFETDKWVSKLMGDRSLGQQPQLYNSKMLGLVTKFQLEVRNQLDAQFYDTVQETKVSNEQIQNGLARNAKTAAQVASTFTQLAVAQHLFGMAFESVAGYNPAFDIIEVLMTAFGFDDEEDSEDTALDNIEQGFLALLEDMPYASTFLDGGRIPISDALPINELVHGKDQYGNDKSRWKTAAEVAPYYFMPGGYGQAKKTTAGLKMFSDEHPIAGSYTDAGNLRFPVEDTLKNRIHAGIFGQYANENARKYFDEEQRTLNPEQTEIFAGLDIPIEDYWEYRDNLYEFYDVRDALKEASFADDATDEDVLKYAYISNVYSGIYDRFDQQKEIASGNSSLKKSQLRDLQSQMEKMLSESKYALDNIKISGAYGEVGSKRYNKDTDSGKWYEIKPKNADGSDNWYYQKEQEVTKGLGISYEEYWNDREEYNYAYDKPGRYAIAKAVGGYDSYMEHYDVLENWQSDNYLAADKDSDGNSISGSRKKKVIEYIDGLDADYGEKLILYRTVYSSKADKRAYNMEIVNYLNSRDDISYEEKKSILEELEMEVDDEGYIAW